MPKRKCGLYHFPTRMRVSHSSTHLGTSPGQLLVCPPVSWFLCRGDRAGGHGRHGFGPASAIGLVGGSRGCVMSARRFPPSDGGLVHQGVGRSPKPMKIRLSHFIKNI